MRFALLGDHPDGLGAATAFIQTGRHELAYYSGPPLSDSWRERFHLAARENDIEEILADPAIEFVIVASKIELRAPHLRRVLQSERHALCVHPVSDKPDAAYEAGMLQQETHQVVLPLLGHGLHPAVRQLRKQLGPHVEVNGVVSTTAESQKLDIADLIVLDYSASGSALFNATVDDRQPGVPIWDLLRAVGGEIVEVGALAPGEVLTAAAPVLLTGKFAAGTMYRATLLSHQPAETLQVRVLRAGSEIALQFPHGWPGPALLGWHDTAGEWCEEAWDARDIWSLVVEIFEKSVGANHALGASPLKRENPKQELSWQDAIRSLELDDAARRSVKRRRVMAVEYPEASEEISFKGTMTLVGCAILWGIIVLAILSRWWPWVGWGVVPLLCVFLFLQVFRWVIPAREHAQASEERQESGVGTPVANAPGSPESSKR